MIVPGCSQKLHSQKQPEFANPWSNLTLSLFPSASGSLCQQFFSPKRSHQAWNWNNSPSFFSPLLHLFQHCSPCLRRCLLHLSKCYLGSLPSQLIVLSPCSEPCWRAVCMSHWRVWWYLCVHGFRALSEPPEHRVSCMILRVQWVPRSGCQHPVQAQLLYPPGGNGPLRRQ